MSDFSELCPLFNTGVFNEILFPCIRMTLDQTELNALEGKLTAGAHSGNFTFGRTVVITNAYVRRWTINAETVTLHLDHRVTSGATQTRFGTHIVTATVTSVETKYTWMPFDNLTAKTFLSNEILGLSIGALTLSSGGEYDLIIRYKEK